MRITTLPFIEHDVTPQKFDAVRKNADLKPSPKVHPQGLPPRHPGMTPSIEAQTTSLPPRSTSPFARKTPLDSLKVADNGCASSSLGGRHSRPQGHPQALSAFQVAPGNLNEQNICAGLSTEWLLLNGHGNAPDRLATLAPGSAAHRAAAEKHDIYLAAIAQAHQSGATHPLNDGANTILSTAGLKKLGDSIPVFVESAQDMDGVAQHLTQANTRFLLSLRFMNGHGHAIAATHQGGQTRLFDPNLGEFQASSRNTAQLLKQLASHYESRDLDLGGINMHRVK
jgi:YopT-type cysteine protease-like protein